ncbi:Dynamin-related protein 4C [Cardamine amara subsp. amara]|uniref:Dynamin-related protein 4C n=1 Tax=Cardamine amara subsp. amara TaxID=228776 RepID=A0ABD1AR48_CARAN
MMSWNQKTYNQQSFINSVLHDTKYPDYFQLNGFEPVLDGYMYWTIVLRRIVDNLELHLQFTVRNLVNKELQKEIVAEMVDSRSNSGGGLHRLMEESPSVMSMSDDR